MKRIERVAVIVGVVALVLGLALPVCAQTAESATTDPRAKLNIWEGRWNVQIQTMETAYSHAGTSSYHGDCSWLPNHGFMLCDFITNNAPSTGKPGNAITILSYSESEKAYKHLVLERDLNPEMNAIVAIDGNVWTVPFEISDKGKTYLCHDVYNFVSPSKFLMRFEMSSDAGRHWVLVMKQEGVLVQ
jgi:hypothetical protein